MKSTAPPAKADITGARLAASVGVNVFFLTNCLVELSVTNYALASDQLHFLQAFLRWRDASIIAWIMYDMMSLSLSLSRSLPLSRAGLYKTRNGPARRCIISSAAWMCDAHPYRIAMHGDAHWAHGIFGIPRRAHVGSRSKSLSLSLSLLDCSTAVSSH